MIGINTNRKAILARNPTLFGFRLILSIVLLLPVSPFLTGLLAVGFSFGFSLLVPVTPITGGGLNEFKEPSSGFKTVMV